MTTQIRYKEEHRTIAFVGVVRAVELIQYPLEWYCYVLGYDEHGLYLTWTKK